MQSHQLIGLLLFATGVLLAWYGLNAHRRHGGRYATALASWARTEAVVTDARLIDHEHTDSDGDSVTWYEGRLRYRYSAGGAEHEGTRAALSARRTFHAFAPAQRWLVDHSPGTTIEAWFDPENPADSAPYLDKPSVLKTGVTVFAGATFVVVALAMLLIGA